METLGGNLPNGLASEIWWGPSHAFKSSLFAKAANELCNIWTQRTNKQWTAPLGGLYGSYEIVVDVLKRVQALDKEAVRKAFAATNLSTIQGQSNSTRRIFPLCLHGAFNGSRVKSSRSIPFLFQMEITRCYLRTLS
jgi:hypothetical protein